MSADASLTSSLFIVTGAVKVVSTTLLCDLRCLVVILLLVVLLSYLYGATIVDFPAIFPFYSPEEVSYPKIGICLTLAELGDGVVDAVELICYYCRDCNLVFVMMVLPPSPPLRLL